MTGIGFDSAGASHQSSGYGWLRQPLGQL